MAGAFLDTQTGFCAAVAWNVLPSAIYFRSKFVPTIDPAGASAFNGTAEGQLADRPVSFGLQAVEREVRALAEEEVVERVGEERLPLVAAEAPPRAPAGGEQIELGELHATLAVLAWMGYPWF